MENVVSIEALELEHSYGEEPPVLCLKSEKPADSARSEFQTPDHADTDDLVKVYLREIKDYPLLTADEEVELAKQIEAGANTAAKLAANDNKPKDLVEDIRPEVIRGVKAKEHLINSNLRLVVSIAKRYQASGMSLLDLIQHGNLGLMKATEKFDYRRGFKFSTYATWWIRQALIQGVGNEARTIRIPVDTLSEINQIRRAQAQLYEANGREPSIEEIADRTNNNPEKVRLLLEADKLEPNSLDEEIKGATDDMPARSGYDIYGQGAPMPEDEIIEAFDQKMIYQKLKSRLTTMELKVVALSFGLVDGIQRKPTEVKEIIGVEDIYEVARIKKKAFAKLRHPSTSYDLKQLAGLV